MKKLGIESESIGLHSLRHACATQLLRRGSSLRDIADFLGHRDMKSVSIYKYLTEFYPLWAGWATKQQAAATEKHLSDYEKRYGLSMSAERSGMQWDDPFGWAPVQWFAVKGLLAHGYIADAQRIARKYMDVVNVDFSREHAIREKYDMEIGSSEVQVRAGYKSNAVGFGWTNGVYREFAAILSR
jgi:alpha,alpha-trehalase